MVECLTRDRGAAGLSLTGVTVLCPLARHINPSLALVQPRKIRPFISERLLMGCKESNLKRTKKLVPFPDTWPRANLCPQFWNATYPTPPPPHLFCFWQNKVAFKYIADPITNQITHCTSIPSEWSITKAWLKMSLKKKTVNMKNLLQNHWFFCGK